MVVVSVQSVYSCCKLNGVVIVAVTLAILSKMLIFVEGVKFYTWSLERIVLLVASFNEEQ